METDFDLAFALRMFLFLLKVLLVTKAACCFLRWVLSKCYTTVARSARELALSSRNRKHFVNKFVDLLPTWSMRLVDNESRSLKRYDVRRNPLFAVSPVVR
jgi:hypothetical protein